MKSTRTGKRVKTRHVVVSCLNKEEIQQLHIVTYNRHSEKYDNTKKVKMVKIVLFHYRNLFTGKQTNE